MMKSDLYPLLLSPEFSPRVWGTRDLSPIYSEVPHEPIGEAWLTGESCKVQNGPLAGRTLGELTNEFGRELVGETASQPNHFPLLIKFLFPRDKLSLQVHPDDDYARRLGQACGKNECWYVLAADPGAQIGLGLKPGTTRLELRRAIEEVRAEELLNWVDIAPGDLIYVDAGTVHTIGPGSILVETQQNSDTTFRLYDYGRPRQLHIEQGIEATKLVTRAGKVTPTPLPDRVRLITSSWFIVEKFKVGADEVIDAGLNRTNAVQCVVAVDGCGIAECDNSEPVLFARGEAVVIPAALKNPRLRGQWSVEFLRSHVPAGGLSEPATTPVTTAVPTF